MEKQLWAVPKIFEIAEVFERIEECFIPSILDTHEVKAHWSNCWDRLIEVLGKSM